VPVELDPASHPASLSARTLLQSVVPVVRQHLASILLLPRSGGAW
jgi:hypothetical protein